MKRKFAALLSVLAIAFTSHFSMACSPCGALSNITQNINGNNLELTFTSNAGWECCYTVQIEIICENQSFTGVPNYFSDEICINGGSGVSTTYNGTWDYPLTVIDVSNFCPGNYQWRATETGCGIYTSVYNFTVTGNFNPLVVNTTQDADTICGGENVQLGATAQDGCNGGPYQYSWSPTAGLSNPNIANPVATPSATTTYTLTVSEVGFCTAPATADVTIVVSPQPTATISGSTVICDGDSPPVVTFTGANGSAPYAIEYTMNGTAQIPVVTTGNTATINAPNSPPGDYTYTITNVTEGSAQGCTNNAPSSITITVNPLPIVEAGEDWILCEPNGQTPSEVTLSGSGAVTYDWDNGAVDSQPFTPPPGTTIFTVVGTDANGCQNSDALTVVSLVLPVANGTADPIFGNAPLAVDFTNTSENASTYTWDFGDNNNTSTTGATPVSNTYLEAGLYDVVLTASNGICETTWTIQIEVIPPMVVTPPNVFTPDEDQINDVYWVDVKYGEFFEATILNRWGNVFAEFDSLNQTWDGKSQNGSPADEGVYFIRYKATDYNGNTVEGHDFFHLER